MYVTSLYRYKGKIPKRMRYNTLNIGEVACRHWKRIFNHPFIGMGAQLLVMSPFSWMTRQFMLLRMHPLLILTTSWAWPSKPNASITNYTFAASACTHISLLHYFYLFFIFFLLLFLIYLMPFLWIFLIHFLRGKYL